MGIFFVILIHLVAIFILSAIIAVFAGIITYFVSAKQKRKRKLLLATLSPFVGLYIAYFFALFGSAAVSEYKKIDIGIGEEIGNLKAKNKKKEKYLLIYPPLL